MNNMTVTSYNRQLINEVKKYPNIYDQKHENFKDDKLKKETWTCIGSALKEKPEEVIRRWKNLRSRYSRIKKALISEGDEGYKRHGKWPYLEDMSFLWDFTFHRSNNTLPKKRKCLSTGEMDIAKHWLSVSDEEEFYSFDPANCLIVEEQTEGEEMLKKRMKLERNESQDFETTPSVDLSPDEDELFCQSIVKSLRRFCPQRRAYAKLRIQQVFYETELYANSFHKTKPRSNRSKSASI